MLSKQIGFILISAAAAFTNPASKYYEFKLDSKPILKRLIVIQKPSLVEVVSYKLIFDGNFKPRYKVQLVNNSKIPVIGYNLTISLVNRKTKDSNCKFDVRKKQTVPYKKVIWITGEVPQFDQICDYDHISVMLTGVVFADGTKMSGLQLLLNAKN